MSWGTTLVSAKSGCGRHAPRVPLVRLAQAEADGPHRSISGKQLQARIARTYLPVQLVATALAHSFLYGISEFWNIFGNPLGWLTNELTTCSIRTAKCPWKSPGLHRLIQLVILQPASMHTTWLAPHHSRATRKLQYPSWYRTQPLKSTGVWPSPKLLAGITPAPNERLDSSIFQN